MPCHPYCNNIYGGESVSTKRVKEHYIQIVTAQRALQGILVSNVEKATLKMYMHIYLLGIDFGCSILSSSIHLCMQAVRCAASHEPSLFTYAIRTKISGAA